MSRLERFFTYVHPSLSLFDKGTFLQRHAHGLIAKDLLLTILAISSHMEGFSALWIGPSLKSCLEQLLATRSFEMDSLDDMIPLSIFQQACLLAFFEFHQYPGRKAWVRISELTRMAYQFGLHQIDNPKNCPLYINGSMTVEETEEWRRLWWCIYCLDSYCNITAGTPFVIDLETVRTALIADTPSPQCHSTPVSSIFLPADTAQLWEISKVVSSRPGNFHVNVHIMTTTILRKAGKLRNLWQQDPSPGVDAEFDLLDDHLSSVRLALPSRYLDVSRNVLNNEPSGEHHARLICILHLHAARALIVTPRLFEDGEERWRRHWQDNLECCEEIVSVVKQWKAQLCLSVDPAICFIISGTLMALHLHYMDIVNSESFELLSRVRRQMELLQLFLGQFASIWHLPKFLIGISNLEIHSVRQLTVCSYSIIPEILKPLFTPSNSEQHCRNLFKDARVFGKKLDEISVTYFR
jgi:hypothetical protein